MRKKMRNRVLSAMICLLMIIGMIPVMPAEVHANEDSFIYVAGIPVTQENASDILGDADDGATVSYDASTNTLILNGATINAPENAPAIEIRDGHINLLLHGTNNVYGTTQLQSTQDAEGKKIWLAGNAAISLEDEVVLTVDAAPQGTLGLEGGSFGPCGPDDANAISSIVGNGSFYVHGGTLSIQNGVHIGGDFTVDAGDVSARFIHAKNVNILGGSVASSGSVGSNLYYDFNAGGIHSIYAKSNIYIVGGDVIADIYAEQVVGEYKGEIDVSGVLKPAHGLYAGDTLTIAKNANVTTTGSIGGYRIAESGIIHIPDYKNGDSTEDCVKAGHLMKANTIQIIGGTVEGSLYGTVNVEKLLAANVLEIRNVDAYCSAELNNPTSWTTYEYTNDNGRCLHFKSQCNHGNGNYIVAGTTITKSCSTCGISIATVNVSNATAENGVFWFKAGETVTILPQNGHLLAPDENTSANNSLTLSNTANEICIKDNNDNLITKMDLSSVVKWDGTAPTGTITMDDKEWSTLSSMVAIKSFLGEEKTIAIHANDEESGIDSVKYFIADRDLVGEEISIDEAIAKIEQEINGAWVSYANPFDISIGNEQVIYVKITDLVGNITYLNSDGILLYKESAVVENITYEYKNGETLQLDVEFNGNSLKSLSIGDEDLVWGTDYHVNESENDGHIMLDDAWLNGLNVGEYVLTATFFPQGNRESDVLLEKTILLTIERAPLTIVDATAKDKVYDGSDEVEITSVEISGVKDMEEVFVDISKVTGILPSANADSYSNIRIEGLDAEDILGGADAENYKIGNVDGVINLSQSVEVEEKDLEIGSVLIYRDYVYTTDYIEVIDLLEYLPEDCGSLGMACPEVIGDIEISEDDFELTEDYKLSFPVSKGEMGDKSTIYLHFNPTNYSSFSLTIEVTRVDKYTVSPVENVSLKSDILYVGEALSELEFNPVKFMANGQEISGTLAWQDATLVPAEGTTSATWVFTPENTELYQTLIGTVAIGVYSGPHIDDEEDKQGWDVIREALLEAEEGDTVKVDMNGEIVVPGDIIASIKGKDISIVFDMGEGVIWSVNGKTVTKNTVEEVNFGVIFSSKETPLNRIPESLLHTIVGNDSYVEMRLLHNGDFGFTAEFSISLGEKYAGLSSSIYYYNVDKQAMELVGTDEIAANGIAVFSFTHASDYVIVIDDANDDADDETDDEVDDETDDDTDDEVDDETDGETDNDADDETKDETDDDIDNVVNSDANGDKDDEEMNADEPTSSKTGKVSIWFAILILAFTSVVIAVLVVMNQKKRK